MRTPCFQALTRPVSFAGLPLTYVIALVALVAGGFVASLSFVWLIASAILGYAGLRALANYDARLVDVMVTAVSKTPPPPGWFRGAGIIYRV